MQSEPGVHARFLYHPKLNGLKSKEAGRPIYEDKIYIEILIAGMDKQTVVRPVQERDKTRFAAEWAAFERGEESRRTGTPIAEWPRMMQTPAMVKMLEAINIHTVEDVAHLSDEFIPKLGMGGYKMREEAQRFIASASVGAREGELEDLRAKNTALEDRLAALEAALAAKPAEPVRPERKKPGPKPKHDGQSMQ